MDKISTSTVLPDKNRLKYADYAKALTIILVILGHTNGAYVPNTSWLYLDFCYAFHMPLFFMLSGFFLHTSSKTDSTSLWEYSCKDFKALMLPFLLWGMFYMPFTYFNLVKLAYGSWLSISQVGSLSSLWFLPVLFLSKMYCNAVFISIRRNNLNLNCICCIMIPIAFAIGFLLPHHNAVGGHAIGNFWGYDIAFVAAGFMMSGTLLRPLFDSLARMKFINVLIAFLLFSTAFYFSFTLERPLLKPGVTNTMLMCNAEYGPIIYCLLNAYSGSFALIALSILLEKMITESTLLLFVGANTMGIYLTHKHIIFALKEIGSKYGFVPMNLLTALCYTIPTLFLSLMMVFVILRYAPRPFGKKIPQEKRKTIQEMFEFVFCDQKTEV